MAPPLPPRTPPLPPTAPPVPPMVPPVPLVKPPPPPLAPPLPPIAPPLPEPPAEHIKVQTVGSLRLEEHAMFLIALMQSWAWSG
jgi:hypothetical protein